MKKILYSMIAMTMVLLLTSCSWLGLLPINGTKKTDETVAPYLQVVPEKLTYSEGYEPIVSHCSYDALPHEGEKLLYQKMLDICYDISPDMEEDEEQRYPMPQIKLEGYSLSQAQVRTACKALVDDHPEIFWLTATIGYYSSAEMTVIRTYSSLSAQQVDTRVNAVRAIASEFYATVPDGLSEYEREKKVHDYLIDHVTYDEDVDTINFDNNNPEIYTAYGALVNGTAVCEGYTRAFQMLLNGLGVECTGVIGKSEGQMHIWNAVQLDDDWYYTDVTWDDQEQPYARYLYFNVDEDYLLDDHSISPLFDTLSEAEINGEEGTYSATVMNIFVPECDKTDKGYYVTELPHLSDYDGDQVKTGLLKSADNSESYFSFYVDESLDFNETVTLLFKESPQYFFNYANAVNNTLDSYSIDVYNMSYLVHEKCRMITVLLHYL